MESARTYPAAAVCDAAGIEQATLRNWRKRGLVRIENEKTSAQAKERTRYTEIDALKVCLLAAFSRCGFDLELVQAAFDSYTKPLGDRLYDYEKPLFLSMSFTERSVAGRRKTVMACDLSRTLYEHDLFSVTEPTNTVAIVIDLAKIFRNALDTLNEGT